MGLYCFKGKYTKEALAAITRSGDNREKAIRGPIEKLGGKLHGWYGMFGEDYNFMVIAEYLAMAMAGIMGGALADFRTIALYTADDVVAGSKLFHERDIGYKAPGA